jgi:hypothetical protein
MYVAQASRQWQKKSYREIADAWAAVLIFLSRLDMEYGMYLIETPST